MTISSTPNYMHTLTTTSGVGKVIGSLFNLFNPLNYLGTGKPTASTQQTAITSTLTPLSRTTTGSRSSNALTLSRKITTRTTVATTQTRTTNYRISPKIPGGLIGSFINYINPFKHNSNRKTTSITTIPSKPIGVTTKSSVSQSTTISTKTSTNIIKTTKSTTATSAFSTSTTTIPGGASSATATKIIKTTQPKFVWLTVPRK